MIRRTCVISVVVILCVVVAAPALAAGAILPVPVDAGARLVAGTDDATWMWSESGGATLKATYVPPASDTPVGPYTVVSGIAAPGAWYAGGDGLFVNALWKDGDTVYVKRYSLSGGADVYGRTAVCTDAQAATLRGVPGTTVAPAGIAADGSGGAYIWCTVSGAPTGGYTLVNHVDATGHFATTSPVMKAVTRTVVSLKTDDTGHACLLLGSGTAVSVDRWGPTLTSDWTGGARNPYLIPPSTAGAMTAVDLVATDDCFVAWRETGKNAGKVMLQRFQADGDRIWPNPPGVAMPAGAVRISPDGAGGVYTVGPSGAGLVARHMLARRLEASWDPSALSLGLASPQVDAVTGNRAGDLFVTYSNATGATADTSGMALMTFTGAWSGLTPASLRSARYPGAVPDGAGGAYVIGSGAGAQLWHVTGATPQVTLRPQARLYQAGSLIGVTMCGYATQAGGLPAQGVTVDIGTLSGAEFTKKTSAVTQSDGFFTATLKPTANAAWAGRWAGATSDGALVQVAPKISLTLSHPRSSSRLTEIFNGTVSPNHAGQKILVQKKVGSGWKTVASGRLSAKSAYRISWAVPSKTATYKLRAILPAHADHAVGTSRTATFKVVIRR